MERKCPFCGCSSVISDKDMEVWKGLDCLIKAGIAFDPNDPACPHESKKFIEVEIDTTPLNSSK